MLIETSRFGQIEVAEEGVFHFPGGLYGLPQARHYCLIPHDDRGHFFWLQSTDVPEVAMVVTDPFLHFPDYEIEIPDAAAALIEAKAAGDVAVYTTITIAPGGSAVHANLLGPIAINHEARLGAQVVQDSRRYTIRHPIGRCEATEEAA